LKTIDTELLQLTTPENEHGATYATRGTETGSFSRHVSLATITLNLNPLDVSPSYFP
jgi:predicted SprT family Zn-dependent metalloprotease